MRVLHVMPSLAASYGGPAAAMPVMARGLIAAGVEVDVAAIDDSLAFELTQEPVIKQMQGFKSISFPITCRPYRISISIARWLSLHAGDYDLIHIHAVFTFSSWVACRAAHAAGVPFVVRPLGILNRWGMENRRPWLKRLFFRCVEKPFIDHAAAIHFTSEQEAMDVARLHIRARPVIIPLGLDLSAFETLPPAQMFLQKFPETANAELVLFISRLDVKKGLDMLLPAFREVLQIRPQARLVIAGDGHSSFVEDLKKQAATLGIQHAVIWAGFLHGDMKLSALAAAQVFCLPSRSENFGMALLEAMACGLPCVASDQVALAVDAAASDAVCMIPCEAGAIAPAICCLLDSSEQRQALSRSARAYAADHHAMPAVGRKLHELYSEIIASTRS